MILFRPRTIWWPTGPGCGVLSLFVAVFLTAFVLNVHRFLAVTHRVAAADILVVEAWVPEVVLRAAAGEFVSGSYRFLFVGAVHSRAIPNARPEPSRPEDALESLAGLGIPRDRVVLCQVSGAATHRSQALALSVRDALRQRGLGTQGVNVMAPAAHARKTWLAYRRALASEARVGVVSVPTGDYDPANWWRTSQGAKWVIANGIGWLYEWIAGARP